MPLTARELAAMGQEAGGGLGKGLGQLLVARAARQNQVDRAVGKLDKFRARYADHESVDPDSVESFRIQQSLDALSGVTPDSSPRSIIEAAGMLPGYTQNIQRGEEEDFKAIGESRDEAVKAVEVELENRRKARVESLGKARADYISSRPSFSDIHGGKTSGGTGAGSRGFSSETGRAASYATRMTENLVGVINRSLTFGGDEASVFENPLAASLTAGDERRRSLVDSHLNRPARTARAHPLLPFVAEILSDEVLGTAPGGDRQAKIMEALEPTRSAVEANLNKGIKNVEDALGYETDPGKVDQLEKLRTRLKDASGHYQEGSPGWQAVAASWEDMIPAQEARRVGEEDYRAALARETEFRAEGVGATDPGAAAGAGGTRGAYATAFYDERGERLAEFMPSEEDLRPATLKTSTPEATQEAMLVVGNRYKASRDARGLAALQRMVPSQPPTESSVPFPAIPDAPPTPIPTPRRLARAPEIGRIPGDIPMPPRPEMAPEDGDPYFFGEAPSDVLASAPPPPPPPSLGEIADRLGSEAGSFDPVIPGYLDSQPGEVASGWNPEDSQLRQLEYLMKRGLFQRLRAENEAMFNPMLARRFAD